jgi:hypothetical protein
MAWKTRGIIEFEMGFWIAEKGIWFIKTLLVPSGA